MSYFEKVSIFISVFNLLAIFIGFGFAAMQIRSAERNLRAMADTHRDSHDFQRRMAAQNAINQYEFSTLSAELTKIFGYVDHDNPIEISKIDKLFSANPSNRTKLIMLFRHYEGLARGVTQGIYDEGVVKAALRGTMMRFSRAFSVYITQRRTELNSPLQWKEFTDLCEKWQQQAKIESQLLSNGPSWWCDDEVLIAPSLEVK
jgi:Domain of unknown function (DUF4760)